MENLVRPLKYRRVLIFGVDLTFWVKRRIIRIWLDSTL